MAKILVIDSQRSVRNSLKEILEYEKYEVDTARTIADGFALLSSGGVDLIIYSIDMQEMDAIDFLEKIRVDYPILPVIMVADRNYLEIAVESLKRGAFDFIEKPLDLNKVLITVRNALQRSEKPKPKGSECHKCCNVEDIVGESKQIKHVKSMMARVAPSEARVLIAGNNGTGKELVARWLHEMSCRKNGPFVEVNCAAIPSELIESEMFGHEKGAFTSAIKQRKGKFEQAADGTLFLDEIGDMSLSAQAKVLRALQERKITRVGGDRDIDINVRVIAATNKNLIEEIAKGNFREDLYHRLSVVIIHVPSLRERKGDIPLLINHFISLICKEYRYPVKSITKGAVTLLEAQPWTGNIRELRNIIERLIIFTDVTITESDVKEYVLSKNFD